MALSGLAVTWNQANDHDHATHLALMMADDLLKKLEQSIPTLSKIKMTLLTDFTTKELIFLYLTLEEKRKDFDTKIGIVEGFDTSDTKYELYEFYTKQREMCTQWMTQVNQATLAVKAKDKIIDN